jgi:hypothetical protein
MAPLLKLLCAFVVAILAVMSAGDHSGAVAARPVPLHATDTEASLGEHSGRRLEVSPWSTARKAAENFGGSKLPKASGTSNSPGNHN